MRCIEITILANTTFVTIYVGSTLHENSISENNRFKPVLITLCKKNSSETKKDTIEYLKSHSKGSKIYRLSCSTAPNFLLFPTMVTNIFEDFLKKLPSKKFLATPLIVFPLFHLFRFLSPSIHIHTQVFPNTPIIQDKGVQEKKYNFFIITSSVNNMSVLFFYIIKRILVNILKFLKRKFSCMKW